MPMPYRFTLLAMAAVASNQSDAKAAAIVQKITGKEKLAEAPESTYAALIAACNQEL
mgnify:CR=1 FL=1